MRSYIAAQRRQSLGRAFSESVESTDFDDEIATTHFRTVWACPGDIRKRLEDMDRNDCLYVASYFDDKAKDARMKAAVHRAIAKRLTGGKTVKDVFTEEQLRRLFGEDQ